MSKVRVGRPQKAAHLTIHQRGRMSFLNKKSGVVRRVAAVAILGIGLTACGGDDSADEPAEERAATEEVAEEPAAEEPTGDPMIRSR